MKEYTEKQIKELKKNPYVFKVTKHKLYYTAKFKEDFWVSYQAGNTPRKILSSEFFERVSKVNKEPSRIPTGIAFARTFGIS